MRVRAILLDASVTRLIYDPVWLIPIFGGDFLMLRQHLFRTEGDLGIARPVRRDLRGSGTLQALLFKVSFDLLAARAAGFQILFRVASDFRRAVLAGIEFIAKRF